MDETFFALSDPTRRAIVARLAEGDVTVAELSRPFAMTAPAISKHLRVLERCGLLEQHREGRVRRCRLVPEPLQEAAAWVARYRRFWEERLEQLAAYLAVQPSGSGTDRGAGTLAEPRAPRRPAGKSAGGERSKDEKSEGRRRRAGESPRGPSAGKDG